MTACGSFDLEDDDFFDDIFRNVPDKDLSNSSDINTLSGSILSNNDVDNPSIETKSQKMNITPEACLPTMNQNLNPSKNNSHKDHIDTTLFHTPKSNLVVHVEKNTVIDSRFTPGFTPKLKKRKFPVLAEVFSEKNDNYFNCEESDHIPKKKTEAEIEVQDITNSLFYNDDLLVPSWQNLQADVSSKSELSSAKYYSIRRVYSETSKIKLPKHIVVPVLCVLLKKFNRAGSYSVFIDDTGEISGYINKEVLSNFEEYLKDGVSLILMKVAFLCNVLLLTPQNLVSIYLDEGTVRHIQEMDSVPYTQILLKPMSCQCSETPLGKLTGNRSTSNSLHDSPAAPENCFHRAANNVTGRHSLPKTPLVIHQNYHSPKPNSSKFTTSLKETFSKRASAASDNVLCSSFTSTSVPSISKGTSDTCVLPSSSTSVNRKLGISEAMPCIVSKEAGYVSENSNQENVLVKVSVAETSNETCDPFGGNSDLDEFDELLGNLDEKSFLEEF